MKRDIDYVRVLMLEIEAAPAHDPWSRTLSDVTPDNAELSRYLHLLRDEGFIKPEEFLAGIGGGEAWLEVNLTWKGHEFLDDIRDDKVWAEAKSQVGEVLKSASLTVISEVARGITRGLMGLP